MYQDLVIMAVFVLVYSSIAGAVERTWISGAIIFTAFGLLIGPVGLDLIHFEVDREAIKVLAELTLALVLFIDAANADLSVLRKTKALPIRLLLIGLPLKCDMCEGEDEPLCVKWCTADALVLEEREEEVDEEEEQEELEVGLESLADKHGLDKVIDALTRMSKKES